MIDFCLSPLTWLVASLMLLALCRRRRWLRHTAVWLVLFAVFLMTPLGANALVKFVESRAPAATACAATTPAYVVVLAGGLDREPSDATDVAAISAVSLRRLLAAIAQYRSQPDARLLIVGGSDYEIPESRLLERLAQQWGVPASAIAVEQTSRTTWENAEHVAALSPPVPRRFWLVTSALHLTRALTAFRAAGLDPCPLPSDFVYLAPGSIGYFLPRTSALRKAEWAIHEIIGEAIYRVRADAAHRGM